ncbi:MAG: hypothetical protein ACQESR_17000 [Planctomycetota bacterium]
MTKDLEAALEQNPRSLNAAYEKATDAVHAFATIPKEAIPWVHARATIDEVTSDGQRKVQPVIKEFQSRQEQKLNLLGEIRDELRTRRDGEEDGEKAPEGSGASEPKARPKDKRKTPPRKNGREAIFAHTLREHHGYENGEIENYAPIPFKDLGNKFAELTGRPYDNVKGFVSDFLKEHFQTGTQKPYASYEEACKGQDKLRRVLMKLSGDGKAFGVRRDG